MATFSISIVELLKLLKTASVTASIDKEDAEHTGVYVMSHDKKLVGIGYAPGKTVGAYSAFFQGTFDDPFIIPAKSLNVIIAYLKTSAKDEKTEEVTISVGSTQISFKTPAADLSLNILQPQEYRIQEALLILTGQLSVDTVQHPVTEMDLPSGNRFNLGTRGHKTLSALATQLGDISIIPTAHKASWVMMDSPNDSNWNGAIQGETYPGDCSVNEVDEPLFTADMLPEILGAE